ncbi:MAG: DUF2283 domain-containing protein [Spirulinaceae cyanobacterium]
MKYFEKENVIHIAITDEYEADSIEISPDITAELNEAGELIGIEILNASAFIQNLLLESVQAKILNLSSFS